MASIDRVMALADELKKKKKDKNYEISQSTINTLDLANSIQSGNKNALKDYMSNYKNDFDAPVRKSALNTTTDEENDEKWYKKILQTPEAFKDGYDFGDVTKTIGGTLADAGLGVAKGVAGIGEGVAELAAGGVAQVADWTGNDEYATKLRNRLAGKDEEFNERKKNWTVSGILTKGQDKVDTASVIGDTGDKVTEGVGYMAGIWATGGAGLGTTGLQSATMFASAAGNTLGESYQKEDVEDWQVWAKAVGSGYLTAKIERLGGLLGTNKVETKIANSISDKIMSGAGKILARNAVSGVTEAGEEFLEYAGNQVLDLMIDKANSETSKNDATFHKDWNWEEVGETLAVSFLTSLAAGGARDISGISDVKTETGANTKDAINEYARRQDREAGMLTKNEQTVLDKVVEKRIAEAEKDGTKLTNKQKSKIKSELTEDLYRGRISTDDIESVLAENEYNEYKSTQNKVDRFESEINELEDLIKGEVDNKTHNDAVMRINALQEELKKFDTNTPKGKLEAKMSELIKSDGFLQNSYVEKSKRGQKFEADLTKYDEKQRKIIQKAIDSGILNNSTKTHEFVDMVAKLSGDKGIEFNFANNEKLKQSGFAVEGKTIDGFVNKSGITLNIESNNALNKVVGHEITHVLEGTELYTELQNAVKEYATTKGVWDSRLTEIKERYKKVKGANAENELTSDLVGEYLFTDTDFVNNLSATKPNVFKKIYNEIKYLLKLATAGSKEARQLEKVKKTFDEAYKTATNTTMNTKYSISEKVPLENRVSGDDLLDAQDLIDDLKSVGANVDENGYVTVYHQTSTENAQKIKETGKMISKELDIFFSTSKDAQQAEGKGQTKLEFKIPAEKLVLDDIFTDNADVKIPLNGAKSIDISNYLVAKTDTKFSVSDVETKTKENMSKRADSDKIEYIETDILKNIETRGKGNRASITEQVKVNGITEPLIITINDYGEPILDDGNHRLEAAIDLGMKQVPVKIREANAEQTEMIFKNLSELNTDAFKKSDTKYSLSDADLKQKQLDIVLKNNPMTDDYHTGIRTVEDIKTFDETIDDDESFVWGDFSQEDAKKALEKGEITVYSSYPIEQGVFVSTSKNQARDYAGGGKIYSKTIPLTEVAWINGDEGQYAKVENTNYSLSSQNDIAPRQSNLTYGEDVKIEEAIAPLQETVNNLSNQITELANKMDNQLIGQPTTEADLPMMEQQDREAFNTLDESSMPIEEATIEENSDYEFLDADAKSLLKELSNGSARKVNALYNEIANSESVEQTRKILDQYKNIYDENYTLQDIKKLIRNTKLNTTHVKGQITDYNYFRKSNFGKLKLGKDGMSIDSFYQELSEMYPMYFDSDIDTTADQLERIAEVVNEDTTYLLDTIDNETMDYYARTIHNAIALNEVTKQFKKIPLGEAPIEDASNTNDIAPLRQAFENKVRESAKEVEKELGYIPQDPTRAESYIRNDLETVRQEAARVLEERPTKKNKEKRLAAVAVINLVDKGYYISKLARETNNRQLDALWDNTLLSNAQAQEVIGEGRYRFNEDAKTYEKVGDSVYEIYETIENTGKKKEFDEYMYHRLNIERMSLESNAQAKMKTLKETTLKGYTDEEISKMAKMRVREDADQEKIDRVNAAKEYKSLSDVKNKPVFGHTIDADISIETVNKLEDSNPEFSDYAKKIYNYESGTYSDLSLLVESGILSQESANYYKNKYQNYVPIMRDMDANELELKVFGKKVSVGNVIKKATGGNQDIIPLKDAMAIKTMLVQRAANMNKLGLELMNTLNPVVIEESVTAEQTIEDISNNADLLQAGTKDKAPTMTVYEHGVKKTFEITDEIYQALKANYDSNLNITIKPLNAYSNFKRGVLTQYNPFFMVTNAIKDSQDILINSQHPLSTYKAIPEAIAQLSTQGYWYKEMQAQGLFQDTYYDNQQGFNVEKSKIENFYPLRKISEINDFIERVPRMAEYIASRKAGASVEVASLDASRVTTNFKAGGDFTKFLNRNGFTFLNASIQGAAQQVRNVQEAHQQGLKGYMKLATKFAVAALPAILLNNLVWDDDEEYEELSDYIKDNYYIIGKYGDGQFIRIPKGRMTAVIQDGLEQMTNLVTGDDEADLNNFLDLVITNLAPSNPLENNIAAPFFNTKLFNKEDPGKTWYGDDLVPTRLQDKPVAEQFDEGTSELAKWLGEKFDLSPIKIDNLIDQNTGVIGDLLLPTMTAEAKTKNDNPVMAAIEDKFTADSTFDSKYSGDFYETKNKLTVAANGYNATDEDILKNKYMNSVQSEMNDIYAEIREVQNSDLDKTTKYNQVRELRKRLNEISENALNSYENIDIQGNYSSVGDKEYHKDTKNEWKAINSDEAAALNSMGMTSYDKDNYFSAKNQITNVVKNYKNEKENVDTEDEEYESEVSVLSGEKKVSIINAIKNAGLNDEQMAYLYDKYYASTEKLNTVVKTGIGMNAYLDLEAQNFTSDVNAQGKTISGSKKIKVFDYINSMDIGFEQKVILAKMYYPSYDEYNYDIIDYLNNDNSISFSDMKEILETLNFKVYDDGTIMWD